MKVCIERLLILSACWAVIYILHGLCFPLNRIAECVLLVTMGMATVIYFWSPIIDSATRRVGIVYGFRPFMVVKMPPVESEKRFQEIVQLYRKALVIGLLCVALWPGMFVFVFSRWPEFSTFQKIPVAFISSIVPPLIYFVLRKISPYYKTPKEYKGYELAERTTVLYECQIMYALACIFVAALFGIFLLNTIYQSFV